MLPDTVVNELIYKAIDARQNAYAPYSRFPVGAAILAKNGKIYSGCNIENSSLGLTVCAERVALFKAVSDNETKFDAIAIVADTEQPVPPCGACRQVLTEFQPNLMVIITNIRFEKKIMSLSDLLPQAFFKKP